MSIELNRYDICYDNFHHNFVEVKKVYPDTRAVQVFKLDSRYECISQVNEKLYEKQRKKRLYIADVKHLFPCNKPKPCPFYLELRDGSPDKIVSKIRKMLAYAQNNNQKRLAAKCVKFILDIQRRNTKGRIKIL